MVNIFRNRYNYPVYNKPRWFIPSAAAAQNIAPTGVASAAAYGSHTIVNVTPQVITHTGVASAAQYGAHTIADVFLNLLPTGVASVVQYGLHAITGGAIQEDILEYNITLPMFRLLIQDYRRRSRRFCWNFS